MRKPELACSVTHACRIDLTGADCRASESGALSRELNRRAATLTGTLLSARAGGAFLDMGSPFLLQSVGAVVLGGALIFGGSATAAGTLFGSVLLVLIVTTLQIAGLPGGTREIIQGLVIIAVLAFAGDARSRGSA